MKSRNQTLATLTRKQLAATQKLPKIFVGGNVLARGLTLSGLVTTYFTRRAGAADTLLQMGRWFGHRPGYEDLTRVWMDPDVSEHFAYVAEVSQDLRSSVAEMRDLNMTPREFGLKIRLHPETSFLITAANKQRAGVIRDTPGVFTYRGKAFETHTIPAGRKLNDDNKRAVLDLLRNLDASTGIEPEKHPNARNLHWRDVPHEIVEEFLRNFNLNPRLPTSKVFGIGDALPEGIAALGRERGWTIGLMSGSGHGAVEYLRDSDLEFVQGVRASYRNNVEISDDGHDIELSQRRLATGGNIVASLSGAERAVALEGRQAVDENGGGANVHRKLTQSEVLRHGLKGPMLLIYTVALNPNAVVTGKPKLEPEAVEGRQRLAELREAPALVLATPGLSEDETREDFASGGTKYGVKYVLNPVYARRMAGLTEWDDEDED